ncbi:hypothetical protein [Desulfoscipio gibsoniae]|uniref:Peptidase M56 BlaR1 n=1 Tax=Desulfoscipio gibsoniae DSM 7213 TaxID=767817 RepID=R4KFC6_9FIRM|nr:hypothetical protein [Desulfoscipio gibsoniae]AGL01883.1 hypothetical protein Desgi_2472 [Desulfoscipio gibsoniae DSM 7213]
MWLKSFVGRIVITGVALISGLSLGIFGFGPAIANQNQELAPVYQINENGQTYGSAANATTEENEPDLILAEGEDGTIGYVLSKDLNGKQPKTPKEALEIQRNTPSTRIIPLYDVDGKTVIGEFKISKGTTKIFLNEQSN